MKHTFICSQCKKEITHISDISTGYARNQKDEKICFDCCRLNDLDTLVGLKKGEKICLYLSRENGKYEVVNWPGTLRIDAGYVRKGSHNFARNRYDFWFDLDKHSFHGVQYGNNTQICHIRKVNKL